MESNKVFAMKFSKVYPLLVAKAQRKGRTAQEVEEVLFWLTGYDKAGLDAQLAKDVDYGTFGDLDEELFGWIDQAYQFAQSK